MRAQARSFEAQAPFSGVRTILIPPDIVAVPRRSPVPVRKRTPWHPQPDGQVVTERSGAREWFSDRLFVEGADDHKRSGYAVAAILHACAAAVVVARAAQVDTGSATGDVRLAFDVPTTLPAGAAVQIAILAEERKNVLVVPAAAIVSEGDKTFVFVAGADSKAHRKVVTIGLTTHDSGSALPA